MSKYQVIIDMIEELEKSEIDTLANCMENDSTLCNKFVTISQKLTEKSEASSCAGVSLGDSLPVLLAEIIELFGWQGGTIHQVKEEIKKLIEIKKMQGLYKSALTKAVTLPKGQLPESGQYHCCSISGTINVYRNSKQTNGVETKRMAEGSQG